MDEINKHLKLNEDKVEEANKILLYYATMFISTYYESARSYLNKVCIRLKVEEENELKELLKTENTFLDVNLIVIEHLNLKLNKPSLNKDYLLFEALYEAYMYYEFDRLTDYLSKNL